MPDPLKRPEWPWLWERAARDPAALAIKIDGIALSFRKLADEVEALASRLAQLGTRRADRIALLMDSSLRMVGLIHASQRCGATLVPINTRLLAAEIEALLIDAEPRLVLYDARHADTIAEIRIRVPALRFIEAHRELDAVPADGLPEPCAFDPNAIHTILYTSGTTGRPKGAMLTHANHWASATASRANLGVEPHDRWLLLLPLYHVGGLSILLRSVIDGVSVVLHSGFDPTCANLALRAEQITLLSVVPTMLIRMLDKNGGASYPRSLRCVLVGGGPVPQALVTRALELGVPVVPTYGLTEAASQVATAAIGDPRFGPRSCGRPLRGTRVKLERADASGRGEILVSGPTVMAGYFRQPEANAAALREGWLHTGDIGHLDADGLLHIDDRRTDLIVSGGENVYPAEVEAVLLAHPAVAEAAVYAVADPEWGQRVAAAVVLRSGANPGASELRAWCAARLAHFKIPTTIEFTSALPRTAAGKLKRHVLRRSSPD